MYELQHYCMLNSLISVIIACIHALDTEKDIFLHTNAFWICYSLSTHSKSTSRMFWFGGLTYKKLSVIAVGVFLFCRIHSNCLFWTANRCPIQIFFSSDLLTLHPFPSTHKKSIPYSARDPFFFESQPSFFFAFCIPSSRFPWGWPIHSSISRSVVHAIGKNDAFKTVPLPVWLSRLLSKNKARFCSTLR